MNKTVEELNKLYNEAEEADQAIYAEQRSNIRLVAGDHYTKAGPRFTDRVRESTNISDEVKIRLTRNHIQRLSKIYVNAITQLAPGVAFEPANPREHQDQKAAMLHKSVWEHHKKNHRIRTKVLEWATDYVNFGEVCVKLYWDYQKGVFKGYEKKSEPMLDETTGEAVVDPMTGEPLMQEVDDTEKTLWSGDLVFERVFAFNVFRPKACQSMDDAEWIGIRKMASLPELKMTFAGDEAKLKALESDQKITYMVFDANRGNFEMAKDQIMLREIYYRPSPLCPNGYFYVYTNSGILWEGELPFGIFPIVWTGFEQIPTTPRAQSPIKNWKPFQIEINRVASKMAEHQITLGDDKVIFNNNAKITSAGNAPGLRGYSTSGPSVPTVLQGRTGDQYLPYLDKTVLELYQTAMVAELLQEKQVAQVDAYALLLQTAKWKEKFSVYSEKFEDFMVRVAEVAMELTKQYISDDALIPMIGRNEQVNITEFKNAQRMCYQVKVEAASDDAETRMGKQLALNHIIQYAGQNLDKDDLGKLFRQLPHLNNEEIMSDLTLKYDFAQNMILAIERGEQPDINPYIDPPYIIQRLSKRMSEPDMRFLPPQIQMLYKQTMTAYQQLDVQQKLALQRAQQGFIPTDGYLVNTQVYAADPSKPGSRGKPIQVPYSSIVWLMKQLEVQGLSQAALAMLPQGAQAELGTQISEHLGLPQPQQQVQ